MPSAGHHQELRPHAVWETAHRAEGTRGGCEEASTVHNYSSLRQHDSSQNGNQVGQRTKCSLEGVV